MINETQTNPAPTVQSRQGPEKASEPIENDLKWRKGGSKGNLPQAVSSAATGRPSGASDGGSDPELEEARAKRLRVAPAKFRKLYKRAWKGNSRKTAIRAFCLECVSWSPAEVAKCTALACPLHEYRMRG